MNFGSETDYLRNQALEIRRLLDHAGEHPVMGPSLRERLRRVEEDLEKVQPERDIPRAILYFYGKPVLGSQGIDARFATDVVEPFVEMATTQFVAMRHGTVGSRGPRRGEAEGRLFLTGVRRGSFGIELSRPERNELIPDKALAETLVQLTDLVRSAGENDEEFVTAFETASPRVISRLRRFFQVIDEGEASLRMVTGNRDYSLDKEHIRRARERAESIQTSEESKTITGTLEGVMLHAWRFEFVDQAGGMISGSLSENLGDDQAAAIARLVTRQCVATIKETSFLAHGIVRKRKYELESVSPIESNL